MIPLGIVDHKGGSDQLWTWEKYENDQVFYEDESRTELSISETLRALIDFAKFMLCFCVFKKP